MHFKNVNIDLCSKLSFNFKPGVGSGSSNSNYYAGPDPQPCRKLTNPLITFYRFYSENQFVIMCPDTHQFHADPDPALQRSLASLRSLVYKPYMAQF
jgi:hypothetical protein